MELSGHRQAVKGSGVTFKAASTIDRRTLMGLALAGAAASPVSALAVGDTGLKALAFDGFTILDPRPVTAAAVSISADHGVALANAWTNKLFALSWLETSAGRYSGFAMLADAALAHSARALNLEISPAQRRELVDVFARLPAWPDAGEALERMRRAGMRLAFLSNLSAEMLTSNMRRNGLDGLMEAPLSTDRVRAFKPSPLAYAMGPTHFQLPREQVGFVAFGGWDALGAKWFGYRTAWINRLGVTAETLTPAPDEIAPNLSAALRLARVA